MPPSTIPTALLTLGVRACTALWRRVLDLFETCHADSASARMIAKHLLIPERELSMMLLAGVLEDGDEIVLHVGAYCSGLKPVGFGDCRGLIHAA